jgi:hypothetical protein
MPSMRPPRDPAADGLGEPVPGTHDQSGWDQGSERELFEARLRAVAASAVAAVHASVPEPPRALDATDATDAPPRAAALPRLDARPGLDAPAVPPRPAAPLAAVQGYVRPPAKDSPGIIRASRDPAAEAVVAAAIEPARPAVAPLFSNEGHLQTRRLPGPDWAALAGAIVRPAGRVAARLAARGAVLTGRAADWWSSTEPMRRRPASPRLLALAAAAVVLAVAVGAIGIARVL